MALHHRFTFLAATLLAAAGVACGGAAAADGAVDPAPAAPSSTASPSSPQAPDGGPAPLVDGGSSSDGAVTDQDAGKPACNGLVNVGSDVSIVAEASAPPPAEGGAIADGTYVVTSATLYTGPGGAAGPTGRSTRMTVAISGTVAESVFDGITRSATIAIVGNELRSTTTCPGKGTDEVEYTATPDSLTLYLIDTAGTRVYSLDKL